MQQEKNASGGWMDNASSIGRALLLMFLAWIGSIAWRTYESAQENRAQNQLILLRLEKFSALERQMNDALRRIEVAAETASTLNSRLMVTESRVAEHERQFGTYREILLRIEESHARSTAPGAR